MDTQNVGAVVLIRSTQWLLVAGDLVCTPLNTLPTSMFPDLVICMCGQKKGTLQATDETVMKGVQLKLAGAHSFSESLLAACRTGQAHITPHLHKPLLHALLHFVHACIGRLKIFLQSCVKKALSGHLYRVQSVL